MHLFYYVSDTLRYLKDDKKYKWKLFSKYVSFFKLSYNQPPKFDWHEIST